MNEKLDNLLEFLRVKEWIKNVFVFAPLLFSQNLFNPGLSLLALQAMAIFCLLSSGIYAFNDIIDVNNDARHPAKKNRALPSGKIAVKTAWKIFGALAFISLGLSLFLGTMFFLIAAAYLLLNIAYALKLKSMVILDVFSIAAGFVLRVLAGAAAINVPASHWLLICAFLLALFLGFCKRRNELVLLEEDAGSHRLVLNSYSSAFLDQMISIVTAGIVICYILYSVSPTTVAQFGTDRIIYTFPFVVYGIFRYLFLVHKREEGGSPSRTLLIDPPLLINIFFWLLSVTWIIYG